MSLATVKREILETMLLHDKSKKAAQIAKEAEKKFPAMMVHLIWLTRVGYVHSPEKGVYAITESGKKALGIPEIGKETAKTILADVPRDKAFHFYAAVGKPLNLYAHSLQDFCNKISEVSADAIEFHVNRGDFESWFTGLGDVELARKIALLKGKRLIGEELRSRLREIVENRCIVLATQV